MFWSVSIVLRGCKITRVFLSPTRLYRDGLSAFRFRSVLGDCKGFFFPVGFLPLVVQGLPEKPVNFLPKYTEMTFQHFNWGQFCKIPRVFLSCRIRPAWLYRDSQTEKSTSPQPRKLTQGCRISTWNTAENYFITNRSVPQAWLLKWWYTPQKLNYGQTEKQATNAFITET